MTTCIGSDLSSERTDPGTLARCRRQAPPRRPPSTVALRAAVPVVLLLLGLSGCGDASPPPSAPSSAAPVASPSASAAAAAPGSSPRRTDPRWAAALDAAADDGAAAALAGHVGFAALADALADEDAVRALALRALPHADRADLALGALCAALDDGRADRGRVADAIEGALVATRRDVESADPDGLARCAAALDRAAAEPGEGLDAERARGLARRVRERERH
jgi:hypothetical protein